MATNNCDIDRAAVNVLLMEMLEDIFTDKMEGALADKTEEYLVRLVAPILSAIDTVTTTGDVQTLESESGDSTLGGAVGEASAEDVEKTVSSHGGGMPSGDALSCAAESGLAPIPTTAPLGDEDTTVREDSDAPPKRWKSLRRFFRGICCFCRR